MKHRAFIIPVGEWLAGEDMFEREDLKPLVKSAIVHGIALTGSEVLGDTGFELKQGEEIMGNGFNSKLGNAATACIEDFPKHYQKLDAVRKGDDWSLYPTVDATTNGVYLHLWVS